MYPQQESITLYDAVTPVAVTSSTDATPIVVTASSHGFTNGQRVLIYGHTTNIAANGIYKVAAATTNTFALVDEITGASVAGSGSGSGSSGLVVLAPPIIHVTGFRNIVLQLGTSGSTTSTLKIAGSLGKTLTSATGARGIFPNFGATVAPSNPYGFLQAIDLDTAAAVNGATGLVASGTDVNKLYEVNINGMIFLTVFPISWSQGAITLKALCLTNS
jgi:hypothetical protein